MRHKQWEVSCEKVKIQGRQEGAQGARQEESDRGSGGNYKEERQ